jgi:acetolactate synthase small subunit
LEDLVPVWVVLDYSHSKIVERELLLAKVSILGPEHFHELIAHHREETMAEDQIEERPEEVRNLECTVLTFRGRESKMGRSILEFWLLQRHFDTSISIFKP